MENTNCLSQRVSKYLLGAVFGVFSLGFVVLGVTILPVVGLIMALPVAAMAIVLIRTRLNDQCQIDFTTDV
ncbi:hypothetical protein [Desulfobacter vibrioformis]|uniref:hypothetical protein n=1 Tax=Desulfobacter vibrioformis TaxID=34031 RepID=UPI0005585235|nr:hypothetical protein [Desulfobacter vibrioformis]